MKKLCHLTIHLLLNDFDEARTATGAAVYS